MASTFVGPYRIVEKLGAGGMGEVYLAEDPRLDRRVALKTLPLSSTNDAHATIRLKNEARAAAKLSHPNIAAIHDIFETAGRTHIVMEYVAGDTLSARVQDGPLPMEQVVRIGIQLADALEEARRHDIVHRDLKPANVCLTPSGQVKVLDFGLAKERARRASEATVEVTASLTEEGHVVGTPGYMSPEQVRGEPVDHRSDVYSLGVVLFKLSTGRLPFERADKWSAAMATATEEPPEPIEFVSDLPREFSAIVRKAIALNRSDRFQTSSELRDDLKRLDSPSSEWPTRAASPRPRLASGRGTLTRLPAQLRRRAFVTLTAAIATVAAVAFWWQPWSIRGGIDRDQAAFQAAIGGTVIDLRYVAVLPLPADALEDQALSDGVTNALTSKLSQLSRSHGLQVASTSMVRELDQRTVSEVGTELGVTLAILCGVRRDADRLRVTLTLVEAPSGREITNDMVSVERADLFQLQDQVLHAATGLLGIELVPRELEAMRAYGTEVPEAYYLYLQGSGYLERVDRDSDVDRAISTFRQVLDLDEGYALAHSGLGMAYWQKYDLTRQPDWARQAATQCQQALELDPLQTTSHVCLGTAYGSLGRHGEAISEFNRAIELEPASPDALLGLARAHEQTGRFEEAEQAYRQAIEMLPNHWAGYRWLGAFYVSQSRYAEASEMFERVVELTPDSYRGYTNLGTSYVYQERWPEARAAIERSVEIRPSVPGYSNLATLYFFQERRYFAAARAYEEALKLDERDYRIWGNLGDARYWGPDEQSQAVIAYERALSLAEELRQTTPQDAFLVGDMALYNAMLGRSTTALQLVAEALDLAPDEPEVHLQGAQAYQQLEQTGDALRLLGQAIEGGISPALILQNPWFDTIRDTVEFRRLAGIS